MQRVEPGWLERSLRSARRRLYVRFTPMDLVQHGTQATIPLSKPEADDLYRDLDAHFYAWTGQNFRNYEPSPALRSNTEEQP